MEIQITQSTQETVIKIVGRLDTTTAPALDKTIQEDLANVDNIVLDLNNLEYISSAGLRVLLNAQKKMQKTGSMKIKNVSESVMEVFEITGFVDILTIE